MKKDEQRQQLVAKWKTTGLLVNLESFILENMAVLYENQLKHNEAFEDQSVVSSTFRRQSIPLIRRVFGDFLPDKLVSVQAIQESQDHVFSVDWAGNPRPHLVQTNHRILQPFPFVEYHGDEEVEGLKKVNGPIYLEGPAINHCKIDEEVLNSEAEVLAWFAEEIKEDINREILHDLRFNSKVIDHFWRSPVHLYEAVKVNSSRINRGANWLVTNQELAEVLKVGAGDKFKESAGCFGKIDNISIYVDKAQTTSDALLLGYKGANFDSGYIYCPHIPAIQSKTPNEQSDNVARYIMTSRYAKIMPDKTYYANLLLQDKPGA